MQRISIILFFLGFLSIAVNCSSPAKINNFKPELDDAIPLAYDNSPSYIHLPIAIQLKDIENKTNHSLNGLLYKDTIIEDDNIEIKVWKIAPIRFENNTSPIDNGKIKTTLPLKVTIKYRVGTAKLGVSLYNTKEFDLNGIVTLVSDVDLSNWKLSTKTKFKSVEWNESPTMKLLGKNIPVTFLINSSLPLFKTKIERKIDEAISKYMDFKPNILYALEKISMPFQMSQNYESWLRLTPLEIYSTNAKLVAESIQINMGIKCIIETLIGNKPQTKFNPSAIVIKDVNTIPNAISANITAVSTYQDASVVVTKNFAGQEFIFGKKKIKVQNVTIWHKKGKIIFGLDLTGSVNGSIYLSGVPHYNETSQEIYFDQMDYALETENKLLKTANWLAQGIIIKKIEANCKYSIRKNLEEGKKNIEGYLKNYSPLSGVYVNGNIGNIQLKKMQLTNQAILAYLKIDGEVKIRVDGLK
jgi:hypothetical protein